MCFKLQPTYFTIDSTVTRYTLTLVSIDLPSDQYIFLHADKVYSHIRQCLNALNIQREERVHINNFAK